MPSWWGKPSSRDAKKKPNRESLIDTLHRRFKIPYENKLNGVSGASRRRCGDTISEKGSQSRIHSNSRSPSPSKRVARCQSFAERPTAQPLPLPGLRPAAVARTDSVIRVPAKRLEKITKSSLFRPLPRPVCIGGKPDHRDLDCDVAVASVSSESSMDIDDTLESRQLSPMAVDENIGKTASTSPLRNSSSKVQPSVITQSNSGSLQERSNLVLANDASSLPRKPLRHHVPHVQVPPHGAFYSAPDSSLSSPSKSPMRAFGNEQVMHSAFWAGKQHPDVSLLGSGQCSSPGSGYNSGHNSVGGDLSGQLFWQQTRGSPEYSPIPSPKMTSPGPSSRIHSASVTPLHPRAGGGASDSQAFGHDDGKQQSHRLPLPPINISNASPFSHPNSAGTSPSLPRSPGRTENSTSPSSCWKKGKLLGRGTFGHVFVGFNSSSGEMCAMKEVTLFPDDSKSKESAKQLAQEIALLSRLRHPNIVQYYGSETIGDKLYIYLEYVSGGSIYKLLQDYGQFGELVIRNYTQQILSGLAYLHGKNTVHRDIKGANILVDPSGRVKLADFGMAKHIKGQSCPLSFKGSPYWMAPEVIKNSNGANLAVDIWSLGCTVLEMATSKPPWSQYEGVAAMFKIGNSKELPGIPDNLSEDGKDFIRQCLQRNPQHRPAATQLLEHPFVKNVGSVERPLLATEPLDIPPDATVGVKSGNVGDASKILSLNSEKLSIRSFRGPKSNLRSSDNPAQRYISCPVSPIGSPLLRSRSPQHRSGRLTPARAISSPVTASGPCTPITGGNGAIPFLKSKQAEEGFGSMSHNMNRIYANGRSDPRSDFFCGVQMGSRAFHDLPFVKQRGNPDGISQRVAWDQIVPGSTAASRFHYG